MAPRIPAIVEAKLRNRAERNLARRVYPGPGLEEELGFLLRHLDGSRARHIPAKGSYRPVALREQLSLLRKEWLDEDGKRHRISQEPGEVYPAGSTTAPPSALRIVSPVPPPVTSRSSDDTRARAGTTGGEQCQALLVVAGGESPEREGSQQDRKAPGSTSRACALWSPTPITYILSAPLEAFLAEKGLADAPLRSPPPPPPRDGGGTLRSWASGVLPSPSSQARKVHTACSPGVVVRSTSQESPKLMDTGGGSAAAAAAAAAPARSPVAGVGIVVGECSIVLVLVFGITAASVITIAASATVVAAAAAVVAATLVAFVVAHVIGGDGLTFCPSTPARLPRTSSMAVLTPMDVCTERCERATASSAMDISPEPVAAHCPPAISPMDVE